VHLGAGGRESISQLAKITKPIASALIASATLIRHLDDDRTAQILIDKITTEVGTHLDKHYNKLSQINDSFEAEVGSLHSAIDDLGELKTQQAALEETIQIMESSAAKVTTSTSDLTSTTTSYRDALINAAKTAPSGSPLIDPQVTQRILTQAKQVLIDTGAPLPQDQSTTVLHEQAQNALSKLNPPSHLQARIDDLTRLRNGGLLLCLNSKEAADWIRSDTIRELFTEQLSPTATIKDRGYAVLAPFVPLTFSPSNSRDIREIESERRRHIFEEQHFYKRGPHSRWRRLVGRFRHSRPGQSD